MYNRVGFFMGNKPDHAKRKPTLRHRVGQVVRVVLLVYLVLLLVASAIQRRVVFPTDMIDVPAALPPFERYGIEPLEIPIEGGGRVEAWLAQGEGTSADRPGPLVIFAHGNAELIDNWAFDFKTLTERGVNVLLVEYRGYGRSDGSPSEKGIVTDFTAAYDKVTARDEIDSKRVVFFGRSIGTGVACSLARHRKPNAIILASPMRSIPSIASKMLVPRFIIKDKFDNEDFLETYDGPVLILHGKEDRIIPYDHGDKLHRVTPNSRLVSFVDTGHNDMPTYSEEFWNPIVEFLIETGLIVE